MRLTRTREPGQQNIPSSCNRSKIGLSDEGVPMVDEYVLCGVTILKLAERPFVDNVGIAGVVE